MRVITTSEFLPEPSEQSSCHQTCGSSEPSSGWRHEAILEDGLKDRALGIIDDITTHLQTLGPTSIDPSLADGSAGLALCLAYTSRTQTGGSNALAASMDHLDRAISLCATMPLTPSLFHGFSGIAWAIEHIGREYMGIDMGEMNAAVDNAVHLRLSQDDEISEFELLKGLAGLGVYGIECLPRSAAKDSLSFIIERLEVLAQHHINGITWVTDAVNSTPYVLKLAPGGHLNLGIAHGVPGIISFLSAAYRLNIERATVERLLRGAVRWLLSQELEIGCSSRFPAFLFPGRLPIPSRLAWCYGDTAIAVCLNAAAQALGESSWESAARRIAIAAAQRRGDDAYVIDAGLCHGAAGLGHIFNRLYQTTGESILRDAAVYWLNWAIKFHRPGHGIGGYVRFNGNHCGTSNDCWVADSGLLNGAAGIALALLSGSTGIAPTWDRALLLSTRT